MEQQPTARTSYISAVYVINKNEKQLTVEKDTNVDFSSVRLIQIRCVLKVILDSIERVKSALLLPKLLKHPNNVARVLTGTKYQPAIRLVEDYICRRDIIVKEKRAPLTDVGMIRLIDYFQMNPAIYDLFPEFRMTSEDRQLLTVFEQLYKIARHHLLRSSKKEISTERLLHKVFQENLRYKAGIKDLENSLGKQLVMLRWKVAAKSVLIKKCELQMEAEKMANIVRIRNESERCQSIIQENLKNSLEKQKLLESELQNVTAQSEIQSKHVRRDEKRARDEKNKIELQLKDALRKYDRVMGEKIVEHFDVTNELKRQQEALEQFMITYQKEEAVYNAIVVAHDIEEERKKLHAIRMYMMNRAARKIQNYWRKWRKALRKQQLIAQKFLFYEPREHIQRRRTLRSRN